MAIFTPIICGVGGNLVAIQTSRISTYLHVWSTPGVLPLWMKQYWPNPCSTFCTSGAMESTLTQLVLLSRPQLPTLFLCSGRAIRLCSTKATEIPRFGDSSHRSWSLQKLATQQEPFTVRRCHGAITDLAEMGGLQSPALLLYSGRTMRLCSTKGKKDLSSWVLGAWPALLRRVKGIQLASLTCMTQH
uniref:Solute carrier family 41 member n=1 Tax=Felis catus TaxID=9685 RepID=A0ABI7XGD7_FELCA